MMAQGVRTTKASGRFCGQLALSMAGPHPCYNLQNQSLCVKPSAWDWGHPSRNPDPFKAPASGKKSREGMMFGWIVGLHFDLCRETLRQVTRLEAGL